MITIPQSPHTVNDRRNHQTARPGWRPRKGTPQALASDIAVSIREHSARGIHRTPEQYTPNAETQALVQQQLTANAHR